VRSKSDLFSRIRAILESARATVARSVNTTQVIANWFVGREIVEEEQHGRKRGAYGKREIANLSEKLQAEYGSGYSIQNLRYMRQFYLEYPVLIAANQIHHALRGESMGPMISDALPRKSPDKTGTVSNISSSRHRCLSLLKTSVKPDGD
jgi:hypothetical protein